MFRSRIALAPRPAPRTERSAMASLGPTPVTDVSRWKKRRSDSARNPYKAQPSSRTTSSVASNTDSPRAGSCSITPRGTTTS